MYNKKSLIKLFLILAGLGMLMYVHYQFSISFAVLACVFLAAITFIPFFYHRKRENNAMNLNYGVENYNYALISAICLLVLGFCSVYTLNNYFYADKHVYRNIDHHVFKLEGIDIANPNNFILAENSRNAFFDSDRNCGRILINQVSDSSVSLTSEGFSRVVFKDSTDSDGRRLKREVINKESLIRFRQNDTVQFRMNNNQVYTLAVDVIDKDSVNYHITLPDGQSIIADEHRFIIHGISLMELMRNPSVVNADFKGIHLVREKVYPLVKQHDKLEWYKDVPFCLEIQNSQHAAEDFYVTDIKVGNGNWTGIHQNIVDTINIPLGTPFTIGYGKNESQTCYFSKRREGAGSGISLLYKLPLYRNFSYKKDNDFNQICVTTSVAEYKRDARFVPENIILYDIFYHDENINNMQPITVSYVSGPTTQNLEFDYTAGNSTGHRKANPGESFEAISTRGGNHSVTWIAGVENLKDSSPFQPSAINWSILLFAFCLAVLLFVGAHQHGTAYDETREYTVLNRIGRNSFTTIEFIAYAVTLYLVAFRWFLLWRVSVFIPVEQINYFEFNGVFRNHSNGTYLTLGMFAFVGLIVLVKLWICYHPNWICGLFDTLKSFFNKSNKLKRLFNKINNLIKLSWFWWIPVVIFTIIAFVVCNFQRHSGRASILILLPVLTYLFNSFAIAKMYGGKWYGRKEQNDNRNRRKALKVLFWSLVNALAFSGLLLYVDSGYGIIFLTFSLFWMIWMLHEFVTQIIPDQDYTIWRLLTVLMLFVFVLLLFFIYKDIIKFIYDQPFWISTVLITIAGCVLGIILSYILAVKSAKNVRSWILSFGILFFLAGASFYYTIHYSRGSKHTAMRITVLFSEPEKAMRQIDSSENENRYLQTALNHMIIGEYGKKGQEVKMFGDHGHGYFKMQPHSKLGALWNAQLTDISLVRFVIAEHKQWMPFLLIGMFFIMIIWAVRQPLFHRWARYMLIQIPLLLSIQSLLIWMACTQRFLFIGQDFPMISINSRLTVIFYFSLITIWVLTAIYEKVYFCELYDEEEENGQLGNDNYNMNRWRFVRSHNDWIKISAVMLLLFICGSFSRQGINIPTFSLKTLMDNFSKKVLLDEDGVNTVNNLLKDYQLEKGNFFNARSWSSLPAYIARFDSAENVSALFKPSGKAENQDENLFDYRLWRRFVEKDCYNNKTNNVVYAKLKRIKDEKDNKVKKILQIATVNKFYNRQLPSPSDRQWSGSVVAVIDSMGPRMQAVSMGTLSAYRLPGTWFVDGNEKTIVSSPGASVNFDGGRTVDMEKGIYSAFLIGQNDIVNHRHQDELKKVITYKDYFARNVMVNGSRTFFYPMGDSLFWLRSFANELAFQRKNRGNENSDVEITINKDLSREVYGILKDENNLEQGSVIIANGDGEVLTLASYDRKFQLNPNSNRQILQLYDSLEMFGDFGSREERRAFGNINLMAIDCGPGSTQKPLVWTAVASKISYDWDNLKIASYNRNNENYIDLADSSHYKIMQFNGSPFLEGHPFKPLTSDEHSGASLTLHDYMQCSSNVYNAAMIYIGSFTSEQLAAQNSMNISREKDGNSLFASFSYETKDNSRKQDKVWYQERFPIFEKANGRDGQFSFNMKPQSELQDNCVFQTSMEQMFLRNDSNDFHRFVVSPAADVLSTYSDSINGYAYVEKSKLESRKGENDPLFLEHAVRFTAIGAQKVWNFTPWKMAESFGRMVSLNENLHLSVTKRKNLMPYKQFENLTSEYWTARPQQLRGMSDVFFKPGTAHHMNRDISRQNSSSNKIGNYYVYGKTGTIGDKIDHHRLCIIIANRDLAECEAKDLDKVKYVVTYFTTSNKGHWQMYADVIKQIIKSTYIKDYLAG